MKKISDILRQRREERGISLDKVEADTKIKKEFLLAIEHGNFQRLPSGYALGFVKNYSKYLEIPVSEAVPLFRREYAGKHVTHIVPNFRKSQHKYNRKLFFNTRTFLILAVVVLVGIYIFFQYSSLFFAPKLTISQPKNGQTIQNNVVEVEGVTDPYATVTINNEETYVDLQGNFKKSEYLFSGNNKITVVAKNRFGKIATREINVSVK